MDALHQKTVLYFKNPVHLSCQFEIHKYCNGDNSEEYDKHYDSNWGVIYFPETSESESVGCHDFDGTQYNSFTCVMWTT